MFPTHAGAHMKAVTEKLVFLTTTMVQALVDQPDDVHVRAIAGDHVVLLEVGVHPSDFGKVIGRHGTHAVAMRQILWAAAGKLGQCSVRMEIMAER
ncbi:MAG: KH domain-containing protein [Candidatus Uhrbacteria bacterium]|nr:KH domain-containing protein [Candidatus Uhrbacteria bacterium]